MLAFLFLTMAVTALLMLRTKRSEVSDRPPTTPPGIKASEGCFITASEEEAAAERWRRHNAEAKAAGCRCGKPATHVRYAYGTVGIPAEIYSCSDHVNINHWSHDVSGMWIPDSEYDSYSLAWMSSPQKIEGD